MFCVDDRAAVAERIQEWGRSDARVSSGAVIGSLALGGGDRWSDIDLTFAVRTGHDLQEVLAEWSERMSGELGAVQLFDLPSGSAIYRVFLLPGCLQCDLSFAPESEFAPRGPHFRLLFGTAGPLRHHAGRPVAEMFGYAVHHALRVRFCVERRRWWQAGHWLNHLREETMAIACSRRGLESGNGKGSDDLPPGLLARLEPTLVSRLDRDELLRALGVVMDVLFEEAGELAAPVRSRLQDL